VNKKTEKFEVLIPNLDGTAVAERVSVDVPVCFDERIKDWVLTEEAHRIIDDTKARHMGLILPSQMKELRTRLGYSQIQMGQLFQIGEKSWLRWESGKHRPTRSISLLIMALYEGKIPLEYLLQRSHMHSAVFGIEITVENIISVDFSTSEYSRPKAVSAQGNPIIQKNTKALVA